MAKKKDIKAASCHLKKKYAIRQTFYCKNKDIFQTRHTSNHVNKSTFLNVMINMGKDFDSVFRIRSIKTTHWDQHYSQHQLVTLQITSEMTPLVKWHSDPHTHTHTDKPPHTVPVCLLHVYALWNQCQSQSILSTAKPSYMLVAVFCSPPPLSLRSRPIYYTSHSVNPDLRHSDTAALISLRLRVSKCASPIVMLSCVYQVSQATNWWTRDEFHYSVAGEQSSVRWNEIKTCDDERWKSCNGLLHQPRSNWSVPASTYKK